MALLVRQFPCLQDNYGFLLRDETSGKVACVDTPDPDAILAEIPGPAYDPDAPFQMLVSDLG